MDTKKATVIQRIRFWTYKYAFFLVVAIGILFSWLLHVCNLMGIIVKNAVTLSVTGAAIAAFLFTMQSILLAIPAKNAYLQVIRKQSDYLLDIHKFCRYAEISFLLDLIPMLYMSKKAIVLNILVFSAYLFALIFTIWAIFLIGSILIKCERHANEKGEVT